MCHTLLLDRFSRVEINVRFVTWYSAFIYNRLDSQLFRPDGKWITYREHNTAVSSGNIAIVTSSVRGTSAVYKRVQYRSDNDFLRNTIIRLYLLTLHFNYSLMMSTLSLAFNSLTIGLGLMFNNWCIAKGGFLNIWRRKMTSTYTMKYPIFNSLRIDNVSILLF